jgi:hypothetical protein
MADIIGDGKERWDIVTSIANTSAPTAAELNAGVRISQWMTKDGATGWTADTATAPTSSKESTFQTGVNGMISLNNPQFKIKRQTPIGSDAAYAAMPTDGTAFAVRRNSVAATTAYANTGQLVDVFPVQFSQKAKVDQADNMPELYIVPVQITAQPKYDVAVA